MALTSRHPMRQQQLQTDEAPLAEAGSCADEEAQLCGPMNRHGGVPDQTQKARQ